MAVLLLQHVAGIQSGRASTALSVEMPGLATQEPWPSQHLDSEASEKAGGLFKGELQPVAGLAREPREQSGLTLGGFLLKTACGQTDNI
jgi:hypothetical protein